ncbi:signal peptidase I [Candidatus Saccharibacteria bacterium]|nr:signal peptidase I [Candidatus Saccharibacteria bacterium]
MEIIPPKRNGEHSQAYQRPTDIQPEMNLMSSVPTGDSDNKGRFRSFASTIGLFATAFVIAILLNTFIIQSYQVDGQSMQPTLQNDDRLIVNKIPRTLARIDGHQYVPHRADIIIFNQEGLPGFVGQKQLIKRVIGLPGEHVVVNTGKITIYNDSHPEGFNPDMTGNYRITTPSIVGEVDIQLQSDQLFVCGDNRPNSEDSRFFGPINTSQVVAKLVLRILPINKAQSF